MVLRSVLGAVVAVGALGAVAAVLPERQSKAVLTPVQPVFGKLPSSQSATATDVVDNQTQSLIKLASFRSAPPLAITSAAEEQASSASSAKVSSPVLPNAAPTVPQAEAAKVDEPAQKVEQAGVVAPPADQPAPTVVAALPPEPPARPVRAGSPVNINKAPVEVLDHLPGAGRIGYAITRRRPYASIEDLVRKRVLRKTAFDRIRSAITVD